MFERLSVPARQAISDAHHVAQAAHRTTVGAGDLLVGLLHTDTAVAGGLLRAQLEVDAVEVAVRALPTTESDPGDLLRMVMAGAAGVAAARATGQVGTVSCLLALLALEPPSLAVLFDAVGIDAAELSSAARGADDSGEAGHAASGEGDRPWVVTVSGADPSVVWTDPSE